MARSLVGWDGHGGEAVCAHLCGENGYAIRVAELACPGKVHASDAHLPPAIPSAGYLPPVDMGAVERGWASGENKAVAVSGVKLFSMMPNVTMNAQAGVQSID